MKPLISRGSAKWYWHDRRQNDWNVRFGLIADIEGRTRNVRFTPKADIRWRELDVRFVPKADLCTAA